MHQKLFIARQPILDEQEKIFGYELLYRPSYKLIQHQIDDFHATSHTLVALFHAADVDELLMHKKGFINVDAQMLASELLDFIPQKIVLEILESVDLAQMEPQLRHARKRGFTLALDDFICTPEGLEYLREFGTFFDIVKFDMLHQNTELDLISQALKIVQKRGAIPLAEKVETQEEYEKYKNLGFKLFQGYYFAKPQLHCTKIINPTKLKILEILNIDCESPQKIANAIKNEPDIALLLLRLVNSSFFALRKEIASVQQAIAYIGVENVRKWLLLLLYAKSEPDPNNNAILQSVKVRADFMAKMAEELAIDSEKAYLTGILSLVDVVLGVCKEEVLVKMRFLDKEVEEALLQGRNIYAKLLEIAQMFEKGDFDSVQRIAQALGLKQQHLADLYYETLCNKSL